MTHWITTLRFAHPDDYIPVFINEPDPSQNTESTTNLQERLNNTTSSGAWWWIIATLFFMLIVSAADSCYINGTAWILAGILFIFLVLTCGGNMFHFVHGYWPWPIFFACLLVGIIFTVVDNQNYIWTRRMCRYLV